MKFAKVFRGVPDGEIYPVEYQPGDVCPPELERAAMEGGVLAPVEQGDAGTPSEDVISAVEPVPSAASVDAPDVAAPVPVKAGKLKK